MSDDPKTSDSRPLHPAVGDRFANGTTVLTVTAVGPLITWRVDDGTRHFNFNATPTEYARLASVTLNNGATFTPAQP